MASVKEIIIREVEKVPEEKIAELYNVVHLFRVKVEKKKKADKDRHSPAEIFLAFGRICPLKKTQYSMRYRLDVRRHTGIALSNNLVMVTDNTSHFERIDSLKVENWKG